MFVLSACAIGLAQRAGAPAAFGNSFSNGFEPEPNGFKYVASGSKTDGAAVFAKNCAKCHGEDGKGKSEFKTPDFTDPKVQANLTDKQIASTIREGKKGTAMPPWAGTLSDREITAVAAYVRSLGSKTPASQSSASSGQIARIRRGSRLDRARVERGHRPTRLAA